GSPNWRRPTPVSRRCCPSPKWWPTGPTRSSTRSIPSTDTSASWVGCWQVPMPDLPGDIVALIDQVQYEETADFPVERGYVWTSCASVENGNPLFWDDAVAEELTAGPITPPTLLSLWMRPHHWMPGRVGEQLALRAHFDMKDRLGLPEAIISENTIVFHEPV